MSTCGLCGKDELSVSTVILWCVKCKKNICHSCWESRGNNKYCPKCGSKLREIEDAKLLENLEKVSDFKTIEASMFITPYIGLPRNFFKK